MYREVTGSDHSDGSGNLPVHSSVPGGYRCFSFAVRVRIRHGILATVHKDPGIAHVRGFRIGNGHSFQDALILKGMDGMDIGTSNQGGSLPKLAAISAYSNVWTAAMLIRRSVQMGAQQMGGNARRGW